MSDAAATVFVCTSCRRERADAPGTFEEPGRRLLAALRTSAAAGELDGVTIAPVECLAVCKRPCTVSLAGPAKWTYLIGDLDPDAHIGDVIAAAKAYAKSENGIVPWKERPQTFRKGVIARVPPLGFAQEPAPQEPALQVAAPQETT